MEATSTSTRTCLCVWMPSYFGGGQELKPVALERIGLRATGKAGVPCLTKTCAWAQSVEPGSTACRAQRLGRGAEIRNPRAQSPGWTDASALGRPTEIPQGLCPGSADVSVPTGLAQSDKQAPRHSADGGPMPRYPSLHPAPDGSQTTPLPDA